MEPVPTSEAATGPVPQSQRIESLDVLRGFALLGILIINIQSFAMVWVAYVNPTVYGDLTGANYGVWLLSHLLADQKFMPIFSMLFGAGIVLMTSRRRAAGRGSAGVHYRRMGFLLLFGLLHAHLLWYGDILYHYAVCGLVVYLFRNWRARFLILLGVSSIAVPSALSLFFQCTIPFWRAQDVESFVREFAPTQDMIAAELAAYRGGWWAQMGHRAPTALMMETYVLASTVAWRAGGLMLVGMALFKLNVFSAKRSAGLYLVMVAAALVVGIPAVACGVRHNFAANWDPLKFVFLGSQYNYWASLLVSLGWVGLVMFVCKRRLWPAMRRRLAAVGRMALTNYLLQTVICTAIFYGHGLGLFGRVERVGQIAIVLAVSAVQFIISLAWLRHFRFGPAEWLWRTLVYMKAQPMRHA